MGITESYTSHQIWMQRFASHEANLSEPFIQQMRDEVEKQVLLFGDDGRTKKRLEKMLKDLNNILHGIAGDWNEVLVDDLKKLGAYEAGWNVKTLEMNVDAKFTTPSPEQVYSAVKFNPLTLSDKPVDFASMLEGWEDTEVARLTTGVKSGFVQGWTTNQIVKYVTGPGGLADVSERNAKTIARTAVNHVSTQARVVTFEKNSDIVEKYEWVSTLDSRTSTQCRSLDSQVFEIGKGPLPPAHANCRSGVSPVISSDFDFLDKGAKRAARGAEGGTQVSADMTYYEFLKQQPAWFIDKALGPTRGAIFRNSGVTPEEFRKISVDGFNKSMTLEEMAAADEKVAAYLKK